MEYYLVYYRVDIYQYYWSVVRYTYLVLPNISRSKGNQAMKFGQVIEYNMRNIFIEKSNVKFAGETIPRPLSKKSELSISLDE